MKILALDLSTKTGWAVLETLDVHSKPTLIAHGTFFREDTVEDWGDYPWNYLRFTSDIAETVLMDLLPRFQPDQIVIEETNPGRETYTQLILCYLHYSFLQRLMVRMDKVKYLRTGDWRKVVKMKLSKDQSKGNQKKNLLKAKKQASQLRAKIKALGSKKSNQEAVELLKNELNKLQLGKITKKHLSVAIANELYNLELCLEDNDAADAILLGVAALTPGIEFCNGLRPSKKKGKTENE